MAQCPGALVFQPALRVFEVGDRVEFFVEFRSRRGTVVKANRRSRYITVEVNGKLFKVLRNMAVIVQFSKGAH